MSNYQISSGLPIIGEDGMMTTGTGMEFDLPGTWSLDSFLRGGTESKIKTQMLFCFHNCSDLLWEKNGSSVNSLFFEKFQITPKQIIKTVKGHDNSWNRIPFYLVDFSSLKSTN